jgi:hypothetical protein
MNSALRMIFRSNSTVATRQSRVTCLFAAILLSVFSSGLYAQQTTGSISGKITDTTGAVIPDATITITNQSSLTGINLKSNGEGIYSSPPLDTGVYTIEVERGKFRPEAQKDFELNDNQRAEINFTLKPGEVSDVVEVQANAPMLNSFNAELGTVIDNKTAEALPLNGSNALAMVQMNPAVVSAGSSVNEGFNDRGVGVSNIRIGSGLAGANANLLDGANNLQTTRSDVLINSTITGIQSSKVQYGIISSEYGFTSGGIISMTTKSGSNGLHGQVYEYYRNNIFNAKNHFALKGSNPVLHYNQYGAAIGGPIKHDRAFFFGNYEAYSLTQVTPQQSYSVPTVAERNGDFRDAATVYGLNIYDPTSGNGKTNSRNQYSSTDPSNPTDITIYPNIIPQTSFDPAAVAFTNNFIPLPNVGTATTLFNNFVPTFPLVSSQKISIGRLDWQLTNKTSLFVRYAYYENITNNEGNYGFLEPIASTRNDDLRNQAIDIGITQVLSGTTLNDIRIAAGRSYFPFASGSANQNWPQKLGVANIPSTTIPSVSISSSVGVNYGINTTSTNNGVRTSTLPEINDTLSILHGAHSLHIGAGLRLYESLNNYNTEPSGLFAFSNATTGQIGTTLSGNGFASFLIGKTYSVTAMLTAPSVTRSYSVSGFVQDDWRAASRLTLNLGLRYDYQCIPWEKHNGFSTLKLNMVNPMNGLMGREVYAGVNGRGRNFSKENYLDFGPRIGFAFLLSRAHHTVLRGGYALYYAASSNSMYSNATDGFGSSITTDTTQTTEGYVSQFNAGYPMTPQGLVGASYSPSMLLGQSPTVQPDSAKTSASQQFVISGDHEFSKNTVLSILFLQNHGTHFPMTALNLNQLNPKYFPLGVIPAPVPPSTSNPPSVLANSTINPYYGDNIPNTGNLGNKTMSVAQALKPYPYFNVVYEYYPHIGSYLGRNAQILLRRPITSGLQMQLGYNYGKFVADPLIAAISNGPTISAQLQNNYAPHSEYSVDTSDVTHRVTGNLTYSLPFGKQKKFLSHASPRMIRWVGDWTLASTILVETGRPLAITGGDGTASTRPSFVPGQSLKVSNPSASKWFNTAAFQSCDVIPASGVTTGTNPYCFGNVPRTLSKLRGPGTLNINLNLMKQVKYDRYTGEFQVSAYNFINKTNLSSPNTSFTTTSSAALSSTTTAFGTITSAQQARNLQFTARIRF